MRTARLKDIDPADLEAGVYYPSSDDKPMAETDLHARAMMELYASLEALFQGRDDVYFATNMFLYYEQGNPKARKTPDVMFIPGVDRDPPRNSFRIWAEGAVPAVIFEVTSKKTRKADWTVKKRLYRRLGVKEYFLFDAVHDYQSRQLMGFRLVAGRYVPIKREADGALRSQVLGVRLYTEGAFVRFATATGKRIPFSRELAAHVAYAEGRAIAAEQELAALRAQLQRRGRANGRP